MDREVSIEHVRLLRRFLRRSVALDGAIIDGWLDIKPGSRNEALAWDLAWFGLACNSGQRWELTLAGLAKAVGPADLVDGSYVRELVRKDAAIA